MFMSVADELEKLQSLHERGVLSAEELAKAKAKLLDGGNANAPSVANQFRRSKSDRIFGGVCGGLGKATDIPPWVWRVIFCLCVFGFGFGLLLYILLWIFVPEEL